MKRYYLAYGSNLNIPQMRFRCPSARLVGTTELDGYELLFKQSKTGFYLTIEQRADSFVPAAVWEVTAEDEAELDRYEGYPVYYYKKEMTVTVTGIRSGKKRRRRGFAYIMHEDRPVGIPTRRYVGTCLYGYRAFDFDRQILLDAVRRSHREVSE